MKHSYPLPLHHSWPLFERARQFEWGQIHDFELPVTAPAIANRIAEMSRGQFEPGAWSCDLSDNRLSWSSEVYRIFGFPDGARLSRDEVVGRYREGSRAAMESLRAYAIRHRRGFTLDVEIQPARGAPKWMRLIAAPVCVDDQVVKLEGLKFLIDPHS